MLKRLMHQMLAAQIMSALTVSLCLLIDNIMIGQFLGESGLAAYSLSNPVLLLIGAVGTMLSSGVQVVCSRSLGRGSQEETNVGYSSAIAVAGVFSACFLALSLLLCVPLARALGAKDGALLQDTAGYIRGFVIGAPATMGALILVPFLQMAGESSLLIAAVLGMTAADIGLDLLNALVFHGGMFGMGLASSLSYYVAMTIAAFYFLSKKCIFRFSLRRVKMEKVRELVRDGVPSLFGMASTVLLILAVNRILMASGHAEPALAAFTVISTLGNSANCVSTGVGGVSLTLSGILYNEEDRQGIREMLALIVRRGMLLGAAVSALCLIFAPALVSLFIPDPGESREMAILGLRLFSLGLTFCCVNSTLKNFCQGVGRVRAIEIISLLEGAVLPVLAAFVFSRRGHVNGAWLYFLAGEALTLAGYMCWTWRQIGHTTLQGDQLLMLRPDFGVSEQNLLERDLSDMDGVIALSRDAEAFCLKQGGSARLASHLALCIEEMGSNIITYGFDKGDTKRGNHLSIRLQHKDERWVLRFRDDCRAFDPLSHVVQQDAADPSAAVGIRLAMRMADEARYTYSMNLNNLTLTLSERAAA